MKKLISVMLILAAVLALMVPVFAAGAETNDDVTGLYKFIVSPATIRSKPGSTYRPFAYLQCGTVVQVIGPAVYNWKDGGTAWYPIDIPVNGYVNVKDVVKLEDGESW